MRRGTWIWIAMLALAGHPAVDAAVEAEPPPRSAIRLEPASPAAAQNRLMRRWHGEVRQTISPVLREWRQLERATREQPGRLLTAGCRRLDAALADLRQGPLPPAPDPSVSLHLEETLSSLAEAADSCTQGAWFLTRWRLQQAQSSWRELRGRLSLYDLLP